ncbi:MAG: hypothetical protein ABJP45_03955 [Cyclobacteriaceae bacterium]
MKQLQSILDNYLNNKIVRNGIKGGTESDDPVDQSDLKDNLFLSQLNTNSKFNNNLLITLTVLLVISFIGIWILVWSFRSNTATVFALIGGQGISVIVLLRFLLKIYKYKVFGDQISYVFPKIETQQDKEIYLKTLMEYLNSK